MNDNIYLPDYRSNIIIKYNLFITYLIFIIMYIFIQNRPVRFGSHVYRLYASKNVLTFIISCYNNLHRN